MSKIVIDKATALELLDRAVAEKGASYIYQAAPYSACKYQTRGEPACIVGHALHYAGVSVDALDGMDHPDRLIEGAGKYSDSTAIERLLNYKPLRNALPFTVTPEALEVFKIAQKAQDQGIAWGRAVGNARAEVAA